MELDVEFEALKPELQMTTQNSKRNSITRKRREENIEWVKKLNLEGLHNEEIESRIQITETAAKEKIAIQYPGKESIQGRKKWKNPWDFRPKLIKEGNIDLTFEQIWDPLFDDLRLLEGETKNQVGGVLATLYYRIAYLYGDDYRKGPGNYKTEPFRIGTLLVEAPLPPSQSVGPFWMYHPPSAAVNFVAKALPKKWAGMSFEAFLHYNSLLAWNEDMKCLHSVEGWSPGDPQGRINTLLTYIRVIGFILDEVRPSTLLGGFTRRRGMSPAEEEEVKRICRPFVK